MQGWTDLGLGTFELRYLRDKQKREVDFVVVRDRKPWFLVEVKRGDTRLASELDFLTQEMFREANTIGSKANDVEISRQVVEIKGTLEKIRELVQNVE